jgi:DnaJ domain
MDDKNARQVLGVSSYATSEEIKMRYRMLARQFHPDTPGGDSEQFMRVFLAYRTLRDAAGETSKQILAEVTQQLNLEKRIDFEIKSVHKDYLAYKEALRDDVKCYLEKVILSTSSSSELKSVLEKQVKEYLVETSSQFESYIKTTVKLSQNKNIYLFNLFKGIYQNRRKLWLLNLYRSPIVMVTSALQVIRPFLVLPEVKKSYPEITNVASIWWLPYAMLGFVITYLVIQYLLLGARNQFVPPKLSVIGIDQWVGYAKAKIVSTSGEMAQGGAVMGGLGALLLIPEPFTIMVAVLAGSLLGLGGKKLDEQKATAIHDLMNDFDTALKQTDRAMKAWADSTPDIIYEATVKSFSKNITRLSGYLAQTKQKKIAPSSER